MKKISFFLAILLLLVIANNMRFCSSPADSDMVEVTIHALQGDAQHGGPVVVVLTDADRKFYLPLVVDAEHAKALSLDRNGKPPTRPGTHDLLAIILSTLNAEVERVEIDRIGKGKWAAVLHIRDEGETYKLDIQPGDALAIAQRLQVKIFVPRTSMQKRSSGPPANDPELESPTFSLDEYGFSVQKMTPGLRRIFGDEGVLVSEVIPGSPAAQAGLRESDLVLAVEGTSIDSPEHLAQTLQAAGSGQKRLRIRRDGVEIELLMQL
ncbi:MAG TPA: PDZ domain-containing protein [Bacteroidetes bacterium]|nr:PDZ domain-containing protein [Bacteroidota bacterium]